MAESVGPAKFFFRGKYFECPESVYFPSEDSYFLAENISAGKNLSAIDVGCGSGIQSLNLLMNGAAKVIALDINKEAAEATLKNSVSAGFKGKVEARFSDMFENCPEKADIIVFNPPYVVSEGIKFKDLDGGRKGREVLDRFIEGFPRHLNMGGKSFFLQTDINGFAETKEKLMEKGLEFGIAARKRTFFEEMAVYRCRLKKL